jgi:serine/threonine-protein kinase PpkA
MKSMRTLTGTGPRKAGLPPLLACVIMAFAAAGAVAQQTDRPLSMENASSLFQRVLTRPGAALSPEPGAAPSQALPAFQPFYVFERTDGWLRVGPGTRGATGWMPEDATVEWRQNTVAAFTNSAGRSRQVLFADEDRLRAVMEDEGVVALEQALVERADNGALRPEDAVVAVEPAEFVNIRERLYLLPILDFVEDVHPMTYDPTLLMKIASVPLEEQAAPPAAASGGDPLADFDAGVIFVLDTTRSMGPYIQLTQRALSRIIADIRGTDVGERINFGAVGFRDSTEAVPELGYRTKVLAPLVRRQDQTEVLSAVLEATDVAEASSPGFNEDSLAGVEDAIVLTDWEAGGTDRFDGRYIILVTDAGPKDPRDPNARSPIGPAELQAAAEEKGIVVFTLHLKTDGGGEAQHQYAEGRYRALSRFGDRQFYFPIEGGEQDAFEATVTRLVTALTDHVRTALGEAAVMDPTEAGDDLVELGLAMRLAYLGARQGTQAPDVIEGWVSEKAVADPSRIAFEPRLLVTKNELATMAEYLGELVDLAESTRGSTDASDFFSQLQDVLARMAQNPDRLVDADAETLGSGLAFLEQLPYRSQIMDMTPDRWAQSAVERRMILDSLRQKLEQYRRWLLEPEVWTALYEGAPDGEHVFAMPFDILP